MLAPICWTVCVLPPTTELTVFPLYLAGKVIAGTRAKKEFSKSYNAFSSINYPDIASIHDNKIIFYIDDKDHNTHPLVFYHQMNTNIFLMKLIPGTDGLDSGHSGCFL